MLHPSGGGYACRIDGIGDDGGNRLHDKALLVVPPYGLPEIEAAHAA